MSNFKTVLKVRIPSALADQLKRTAMCQARSVPDIAREGLVKQLAALGAPYSPSNDNGDLPPFAA